MEILNRCCMRRLITDFFDILFLICGNMILINRITGKWRGVFLDWNEAGHVTWRCWAREQHEKETVKGSVFSSIVALKWAPQLMNKSRRISILIVNIFSFPNRLLIVDSGPIDSGLGVENPEISHWLMMENRRWNYQDNLFHRWKWKVRVI